MTSFILPLLHPLTLRAAQTSDQCFFQRLYSETRDDLQCLEYSTPVIAQLLALQYQAQCKGYQTDFPNADYFMIAFAGSDCGRLVLNQEEKSLRVVDISLITTMRHQGIGTAIFKALQQFSTVNQQVLRLTMNPQNAALSRFYRRLGFQYEAQDNGLYQALYY